MGDDKIVNGEKGDCKEGDGCDCGDGLTRLTLGLFEVGVETRGVLVFPP